MTKVFYVDESGDPDPFQIPLISGRTPLFALTGLVFDLDLWRSLDREYFNIKSTFFTREVARHSARPEEFEVKGTSIFAPRNRGNKRNGRFLDSVFRLLNRYRGKAFSVITIKNPASPVNRVSVYNTSLQYLIERFSIYLSEGFPGETGIIIIDSRSKQQDIEVTRSHMSFIFGHTTGRQFLNIAEAPLFADSRFTAGLQLADISSGAIFAFYYNRNCNNVPGAINYTHMAAYQTQITGLQFVSTQRYDGYIKYGYRIIDHNKP